MSDLETPETSPPSSDSPEFQKQANFVIKIILVVVTLCTILITPALYFMAAISSGMSGGTRFIVYLPWGLVLAGWVAFGAMLIAQDAERDRAQAASEDGRS